jgi:hypothetical protein
MDSKIFKGKKAFVTVNACSAATPRMLNQIGEDLNNGAAVRSVFASLIFFETSLRRSA